MPSRTINKNSLLLLCSLSLVGCKENTVQVQRIEKGIEQIPIMATTETTQQTSAQSAQSDPVKAHDSWIVPDRWEVDTTPRSMRLATFVIPTDAGGQEVAITRFPGQVGGTLANINRWREQMALERIDQSQLESFIQRFTTQDSVSEPNGYQTRIVSEQGVMIAVALYDEINDQTWFVRTILPTLELADALEAEIVEFARSILR